MDGPGGVGRPPRLADALAGREGAVDVVIVVQADTDLVQVVLALQPAGGLADLLDGGHQQADEDGDDGNDHQQFDQREGGTAAVHGTDSRDDRKTIEYEDSSSRRPRRNSRGWAGTRAQAEAGSGHRRGRTRRYPVVPNSSRTHRAKRCARLPLACEMEGLSAWGMVNGGTVPAGTRRSGGNQPVAGRTFREEKASEDAFCPGPANP